MQYSIDSTPRLGGKVLRGSTKFHTGARKDSQRISEDFSYVKINRFARNIFTSKISERSALWTYHLQMTNMFSRFSMYFIQGKFDFKVP